MSKRSKNKIDDQDKINVREKLTHNVLDLSLMNISVIPVDEIKLLKRATILDLSNNIITAVNADFTTLVQLTKIDLSKNNIRSIADEFGNLVNLRHLDLYNNKIERLPLSFGRLKKLKYLDLKHNPLNPAFSKVIGTCTDQKDCIEAARKAVAFMANIEQQVTEDRRKEREQKKIEEAKEAEAAPESTSEENAKREKKRKPRNKKSKAGNSVENEEIKSTGSVQKSVADSKEPVKQRSSGSIGKAFLYFIALVLLSIAGLGLVFVFKPEFVEHIFEVTDGDVLEEYIK